MPINPNDRFEIQQIVDENLDVYITDLKSLVNQSGVYGRDGKYDIMGQSQFSNFSSVVRDTNSVEAVKIWIMYQIGRGRNGWDHNNFGAKVIDLINSMVAFASEVVPEDLPNKDELRRELYMSLLRQFAGHLERYFYYMQKTGGGNA
jgi:hypothetical protein